MVYACIGGYLYRGYLAMYAYPMYVYMPHRRGLTMTTLPSCIKARRFGHWSMGSENEYDEFGEQAPITWVCNCGSRLKLETFNDDTEEYTPVSAKTKAEFLAKHTSCGDPKCYVCAVAPVGTQGAWCDECSAKEDARVSTEYVPF